MKLNTKDLFTLAEAVGSNETGQREYEPRNGCLAAAKRLVKLGHLRESPHGGTFLPTERGVTVVRFLTNLLPLVP